MLIAASILIRGFECRMRRRAAHTQPRWWRPDMLFAARAAGSLSSTAVLEYRPTEILPSVVAISKYPARLCRPRRHNSRAHPREPRGSRPTKAAAPRETDSPLEERRFEPLVPPLK